MTYGLAFCVLNAIFWIWYITNVDSKKKPKHPTR